MPNWCINNTTLYCPSKDIYDKLIDAILNKKWFATFAPLGDEWNYDIACDIWKTKWDANYINIINQNDEEYILDVSFETAWTPPIGVYEIMYKNFDIEIISYYYELGCSFFGRYTKNKNEEINESFEIPSNREELIEIRKKIDSELDEFMSPTWDLLEEDWEEEEQEEEEEQDD
jgi:hypothetical protein